MDTTPSQTDTPLIVIEKAPASSPDIIEQEEKTTELPMTTLLPDLPIEGFKPGMTVTNKAEDIKFTMRPTQLPDLPIEVDFELNTTTSDKIEEDTSTISPELTNVLTTLIGMLTSTISGLMTPPPSLITIATAETPSTTQLSVSITEQLTDIHQSSTEYAETFTEQNINLEKELFQTTTIGKTSSLIENATSEHPEQVTLTTETSTNGEENALTERMNLETTEQATAHPEIPIEKEISNEIIEMTTQKIMYVEDDSTKTEKTTEWFDKITTENDRFLPVEVDFDEETTSSSSSAPKVTTESNLAEVTTILKTVAFPEETFSTEIPKSFTTKTNEEVVTSNMSNELVENPTTTINNENEEESTFLKVTEITETNDVVETTEIQSTSSTEPLFNVFTTEENREVTEGLPPSLVTETMSYETTKQVEEQIITTERNTLSEITTKEFISEGNDGSIETMVSFTTEPSIDSTIVLENTEKDMYIANEIGATTTREQPITIKTVEMTTNFGTKPTTGFNDGSAVTESPIPEVTDGTKVVDETTTKQRKTVDDSGISSETTKVTPMEQTEDTQIVMTTELDLIMVQESTTDPSREVTAIDKITTETIDTTMLPTKLPTFSSVASGQASTINEVTTQGIVAPTTDIISESTTETNLGTENRQDIATDREQITVAKTESMSDIEVTTKESETIDLNTTETISLTITNINKSTVEETTIQSIGTTGLPFTQEAEISTTLESLEINPPTEKTEITTNDQNESVDMTTQPEMGGTTSARESATMTTETSFTNKITTNKEYQTSEVTETDVNVRFATTLSSPANRMCVAESDCTPLEACRRGGCLNPCEEQNNGCAFNALCTVTNHVPICTCPHGLTGDANTDCRREPGTPKKPHPCESDTDCLDVEACYKGMCEDPCEFAQACADTAHCHTKAHRPVCTCPMGYEGNPAEKCFPAEPLSCTSSNDCQLTEACIEKKCQRPCDMHNPCALNAVCINTNHVSECSCAEGYHGNGFVGCAPVSPVKNVCQYNEDCPPNKACDRLNRVCINPCFEDSCGENAECRPVNHAVECLCLNGFTGNPYVECGRVTGCRSDNECSLSEACINGKCESPCHCGLNAICDVVNHQATCKCLQGYTGNPASGCVVPEGSNCEPDPCGPNSGCRVVNGSPLCFCLPEYEGNPPTKLCSLPSNPCDPSPCGPNTQCSILGNGFAKCTCLTGYLESPNTIRGCIERKNPCDPNPCGPGAMCDPQREQACFCPEPTIGNPYRSCSEPVKALCQPGPCGSNADCYVSDSQEQCYCKPSYIGDPYSSCHQEPPSPCHPNPCGPNAQCTITSQGHGMCECPVGMSGDPTGPAGCGGPECRTDDDCSLQQACMGYKCRDPCPGSCGIGANCRVEKHHPVCTCNHGLTGNPLVRCSAIQDPLPPSNPCYPSPCGVNTQCQVMGERAVCSCMQDFLGDPQTGCRPECTINSDCPLDRACLDRKCQNPCSSGAVCGIKATCAVREHTTTCSCPTGHVGDAFVQCVPKPFLPPPSDLSNPCVPSPCGPGVQCQVHASQVAVCDPCGGEDSLLCRPECLAHSDCQFHQACLNRMCRDPCPGSCGVNAQCVAVNHNPVCSCPTGLVGNPFEHCSAPNVEEKTETCEKRQCGANALCREQNGAVICECKKSYFGDPYLACRPECVLNSDCPARRACLNNRCQDPCAGACGVSAQCEVVNHVPVCFCPASLTGDPFISCFPIKPVMVPDIPTNPCDPSPCGPFSRCLVSPAGFAACSCLPGYQGVAPTCRPECVVSSDCLQTQACVSQRCMDPCPGTCGVGARCVVTNHNPICSCPPGQQGDPFVSCYKQAEEMPKVPGNPCNPSPCGPNSICQVKQGRPVCSCVSNYIGSPPFCRPECVLSQECPRDKACVNERCVNPCIDTCGLNAKCDVVNHTPYCSCLAGYEGDAFIGCSKTPTIMLPPIPTDPCNPPPCGDNAQCVARDGAARCTCIPPYIGNPYIGGCRPECVINSDCASQLACLSQHCRDPCRGTCGVNAECSVVNHVPVCTCAPGFTGDPFQSCRQEPITPLLPQNPCEPSPCGANSLCRVSGGHAVCSCQPNYVGAPPSCRPECVVSSECPQNRACISQKCRDPCPGTCGMEARCQVVNHNPICSCPQGYDGDPFVLCSREAPKPPIPQNPCVPSPCGANSECRVVESRPVCSCLSGMLGAPPNCRPECLIHQDCPTHLACVRNKCRDPCVGSCGFNAQCTVHNHQPVCACNQGYEGDPFSGCNPVIVRPVEAPRRPCSPSPCGSNAFCRERNGAGSCSCLPEYTGDPYTGCRPECVLSSDCTRDKACVSNKCRDPCPGTCGVMAQCRVVNHIPTCSCLPGFTGDALRSCIPIPTLRPNNPCIPTPCGPYSQCRTTDNHAVCSCQPDCVGSPPSCRPECLISSDCLLNRACINKRCQDPCPGTCGFNARCQVVNHNPICSCLPGFTGDPFARCLIQQKCPNVPSGNPCVPSPCGPNSQCRALGDQPACTCSPGYVGRAPNCRPECTLSAECASHLSCLKERCTDPCPGSCGPLATCRVVNHGPVCTCLPGHIGDPFTGCKLATTVTAVLELPRNPCNPTPCGANALCKEHHGAGSCVCLTGYFGDPYTGCRPECVLNADCPRDKACVSNKCLNPCPGTCGVNAECRVINHAPSCSCFPEYTGDPLNSCRVVVQPIVLGEEKTPQNPCLPSPCGLNSMCRVTNGHAVCSCSTGYTGAPPACRPECLVSTECPQDKACINQKCVDPCSGTCGYNARCQVVNHNPICSCARGFIGDPFMRCFKEEKQPQVVESKNPCIPSPCGANSYCQAVGNHPACSCLPNYVGRVPNCRPECTINAECPGNLACQSERCRDPCPGSCGPNTRCVVVKHRPMCFCETGFTGDPFGGCSRIVEIIQPVEAPRNPCNPSPCGANAVCKERNGAGSCSCLPEYQGDPYTGCRPECVLNTDCDKARACVNNKCRDPCPGTCGLNAECRVVNHAPSCSCLPGYIGNPLNACHLPPVATPPPTPENPCQPSPCGPYSQCRISNRHAVCSCQTNYVGTPPGCRPECVVSADCAQDKACVNQRCQDPCPGTCGLNARCQVVNHNPICSCAPGLTGDPFARCIKEQKPPAQQLPSGNPCIPSPCGPNSQCRVVGNTPACSCSPNYVGRAPNCRPECTINAECPSNLACQNERCTDPCPGSCGVHATCRVVKHAPMCSCEPGYTGDPFGGCSIIPITQPVEAPRNPCNPSPCGANAVCKERNGAGSCSCLLEYQGDPYTGCRPECVLNTDCDKARACVNNKCRDPCPGTCGLNAECRVVNHAPSCSCLPGYTGNPLNAFPKEEPIKNPCQPSPCGSFSQCRVQNEHAVCSCLASYIGTPPGCKPECVVSTECPQNRACVNQKCVDPCPGTCGLNARCQVVNHNPICSCSPGFTGDPFSRCLKQEKPPVQQLPSGNPCVPSPCGPNSQCRVVGDTPACSCSPNYVGRAPNCRPECTINAECPSNLACQNERCTDPCPGSCGVHATCRVVKHAPMCSCEPGYTGDPFGGCSIIPIIQPVEAPRNPCNPSPCGANAVCKERNGAGSCSCLPEYQGDPYTGCRPECVLNTDCDKARACVNNKCRDPCPGTCGLNAECRVVNHAPSCSCLPGYTGNPLNAFPKEEPIKNPCQPSPCGSFSQCRVQSGHAVCSCLASYIGTPPGCKPECVVSTECPQNRACVNQKCVDPCPGTCGLNARCQVVNHNPICSCSPGFTGDPFVRCLKQDQPPVQQLPSGNPCIPSPCGANSQCRVVGSTPACSCLPNYVGRAPNCRPECMINAECPSNLACQNERCVDPCPGSCGAQTTCTVVKHAPMCYCQTGFTGDPFTGCIQIQQAIVPTEGPRNPCNPSPCGANAVCKERNGAGSCVCLSEYFGDPYTGCRPECVVNSDCDRNRACLNNKCRDPCPGTCGLSAECRVLNHAPSCTCLPGYSGDPLSACVLQEPINAEPPKNPCEPSPCGRNSQCRLSNGHAVCTCLVGFIGSPPTCRPECVVSSECPQNRACVNQKCVDPCPATTPPPPGNPCVPSPCGPNSQCKVVGTQPACSCLPNFMGRSPNCRPECTIHAECPSTRACRDQKCMDPCPGSCGTLAQCRVVNHNAVCSCPQGYLRNEHLQPTLASPLHVGQMPSVGREMVRALAHACRGTKEIPMMREVAEESVRLVPTALLSELVWASSVWTLAQEHVDQGPNAAWSITSPHVAVSLGTLATHSLHAGLFLLQAVCSCQQNYVGTPPLCRPECVVSSECPLNRACINQKCADPCPNTCGVGAQCTTLNHNPICACPQGFTGDPFSQCTPQPVTTPAPLTERPPSCYPSPCGPNSQCQMAGGIPACSCLQDYTGAPPNCRPECVLSADCPSQQACIKQRCRDPCPGSCGYNANCQVLNHVPVCTCNEGHTGDPFSQCTLIPITTPSALPRDPCNPSPCGPNAECRPGGICECAPEYVGNPYESCRPECVLNTECPRDRACLRNKCRDPCPGTCGQNARCDIVNHIPVCSCAEGFTGDPFSNCRPFTPAPPDSQKDPCRPSPCGPNSQCRTTDNHAVCSCLQGYVGSPPSCRPECVVSSECPLTRACVNQKCGDPCLGSCGLEARCEVINHSPICSCREGQTGDPFRSCFEMPPKVVEPVEADPDPCVPSPCGPNSQCQSSGNSPACSCLMGYIGSPPNCRPECVINPDCPTNRACINNKCRDPCPGSCGSNAECQIISHAVTCICSPGYTGNPFVQCTVQKQEVSNPCEPSPCGANAECKQRNGAGACSCISDYQGNPYEGCRPECVLSSDCPTDRACIRNKCEDPCPGVCGQYAQCFVVNHVPTCTCIQGYVGDPFVSCTPQPMPVMTQASVVDPCSPSPCGPNSQCRQVNSQAVCSCQSQYIGSPPNCRPECVVNSECQQNRACYKFKCTDPCPGTCGLRARCEVINHNPICSCPAGMTGDPFTRCFTETIPVSPPVAEPINPCVPSPCGRNSVCQVVGTQPACSCLRNFIGAPPNCRPECVVNTDCAPTQACISEKCRDPCQGSCGLNTECRVQNHIPTCTCQSGYTGDPFTQCELKVESPAPKPVDPCNPSPCGPNAQCQDGTCTCSPNYSGDPYSNCRPECTMNSECPRNRACSNQRCMDPCPGTCGQGARCDVVNHIPTCSCPEGYSGDPFVQCRLAPPPQETLKQPCEPSPCGPNSVCRVVDSHAVCSCLPGLVGSPPSCRPECVVSAECPLTQACLSNKCRDPCPGTCGQSARCQVVNHNPICSCSSGNTGDPFTRCFALPVEPRPSEPQHPCQPSPCGPNAECQVRGESPACSCSPNYIGSPPNCRPECTINPECPSHLACVNQRCGDPCQGSCGTNARCSVVNHTPVCTCNPGHTGDPFNGCFPAQAEPIPQERPTPCLPSPCGTNAVCREQNGAGSCACLPEHVGNPYEGCRPECVLDSDCAPNRACIRNKCQDPCPGTCGQNADCQVVNHLPSCTCIPGYTGDPFRLCRIQPVQ
uniref:EGF-like domain-containing protein n=1 Tax=Timema monikensis TaxID=170555 RepID=A0A7R9E3N4_9NEOP|nr:unnamed protein product [Timema monikensis]